MAQQIKHSAPGDRCEDVSGMPHCCVMNSFLFGTKVMTLFFYSSVTFYTLAVSCLCVLAFYQGLGLCALIWF